MPAPVSKTTPQPMPGKGTRLTYSALGYAYSIGAGRGTPGTRWQPTLAGISLRFTRGLIELREPEIKGKKMSRATLVLSANKVNADGESWACVEVTGFNQEGRITKETKLEMVQVSDPDYSTPDLALAPIAVIVWNKSRPVLVDPVVHWNLRYLRAQEGTLVRHIWI